MPSRTHNSDPTRGRARDSTAVPIRRPWSTALLLAVLSGLLVLSGRASAQSDPLLSQQWHLLDPNTEPAGANVLPVWPITKGAGIVIVVTVTAAAAATH
jgi:hypothetical protein